MASLFWNPFDQAVIAVRRAYRRIRKLNNSSIPAPLLDETVNTCMPGLTRVVGRAPPFVKVGRRQIHLGNCSHVSPAEDRRIF
jgi:hypothetical protein